MTRADLLAFMRQTPYWVQATVASTGAPQAAVVGVVVTDDLELFFDTLSTSRKFENLRLNPRAAFVMWEGERTVQYEGMADEPQGEELARLKRLYFSRFPNGRRREQWPDTVYLRVKPSWLRYSDFGGGELSIIELREADLNTK